jgi:DMSO/TMAO reductase YedYZ molybdopterin-dependent catalytic subunit
MPLTSKSLLTASPLKLGYKLSKWITAIHVLSTLNPQRLGTWEDQGYEWFAGL